MKFNEILKQNYFDGMKVLVALAVSLVAGIARTAYTQHFFGYALHTTDPVIDYFFYALMIFMVGVQWGTWQKHQSESIAIKKRFFFGCLAVLCMLFPTRVSFFAHSVDRVFFEFFLNGLRTIFIFLYFFPVSFFKKKAEFFQVVVVCTILLTLFSFYMDQAWQQMSRVILWVLGNIFSLLHIAQVINVSTFQITINNFTVFIGSKCAGLGAMSAFIMLSIASYFLLLNLGKQLSARRIAIVFFSGIIGAAIVNFLRIFLLLLIGAYISPTFAVTTFHSFAGSILFLFFFMTYMTWAVKYVMLKK